MVTTRRQRRVDRRRHRGRGAAAGVLLDQGVRPAVQRQVPRRQVLPLPRRDDGRGVPAGPGDARRQAQGHPVLRPLRPRLGDPRDASTCCCASSRCAPAAAGVFKRAGQVGRPCLLGYIDKCSAPCVGRVDADRAPRDRRGLLRLHGRQHRPAFVKRLERRDARRRAPSWSSSRRPGCATTSAPSAGRWRSSAVVLADGTDADVFALAEDELEAAVQVFHVRGGRVRGQRGWVAEKVEDVTTGRPRRAPAPAGLRRRVAREAVPREVLVPVPPDGRPAVEALAVAGCAARRSTSGCRSAATSGAASRPSPATPTQSLQPHKIARAGDLTTRSQALQELQEALGPGRRAAADRVLRRRPRPGHQRRGLDGRLRGRPAPQERVPPVHRPRHDGQDGQIRRHAPRMHEVHRPAGSAATRRPAPTGGEPASARGPDGGAGATGPEPTLPAGSTPTPAGRAGSPTRPTWWSSTAARRRSTPRSARSGRAGDRRHRAVSGSPSGWRRSGCPARTYPVILPRTSEGCTCCSGCATRRTGSRSPSTAQRRSKAMTASALDDIPGLGATRRKALLRHFGSVKRLRAADPEEIAVQVAGRRVARARGRRVATQHLALDAGRPSRPSNVDAPERCSTDVRRAETPTAGPQAVRLPAS